MFSRSIESSRTTDKTSDRQTTNRNQTRAIALQTAGKGPRVENPKLSSTVIQFPRENPRAMSLDASKHAFDPRNIPKAAGVDTRDVNQVNAFIASRCVHLRLDLTNNIHLTAVDRASIDKTLRKQIQNFSSPEFFEARFKQTRSEYASIYARQNAGQGLTEREQTRLDRFNAKVDHLQRAYMEKNGMPLAERDAFKKVLAHETRQWLESKKTEYSSYLAANSRPREERLINPVAIENMKEQFADRMGKLAEGMPRLGAFASSLTQSYGKVADLASRTAENLKKLSRLEQRDATQRAREYGGMIEGMQSFSDKQYEHDSPLRKDIQRATDSPSGREPVKDRGMRAAETAGMVNGMVRSQNLAVDQFLQEYKDIIGRFTEKQASQRSRVQSMSIPSYEQFKSSFGHVLPDRQLATNDRYMRDLHRSLKTAFRKNPEGFNQLWNAFDGFRKQKLMDEFNRQKVPALEPRHEDVQPAGPAFRR